MKLEIPSLSDITRRPFFYELSMYDRPVALAFAINHVASAVFSAGFIAREAFKQERSWSAICLNATNFFANVTSLLYCAAILSNSIWIYYSSLNIIGLLFNSFVIKDMFASFQSSLEENLPYRLEDKVNAFSLLKRKLESNGKGEEAKECHKKMLSMLAKEHSSLMLRLPRGAVAFDGSCGFKYVSKTVGEFVDQSFASIGQRIIREGQEFLRRLFLPRRKFEDGLYSLQLLGRELESEGEYAKALDVYEKIEAMLCRKDGGRLLKLPNVILAEKLTIFRYEQKRIGKLIQEIRAVSAKLREKAKEPVKDREPLNTPEAVGLEEPVDFGPLFEETYQLEEKGKFAEAREKYLKILQKTDSKDVRKIASQNILELNVKKEVRQLLVRVGLLDKASQFDDAREVSLSALAKLPNSKWGSRCRLETLEKIRSLEFKKKLEEIWVKAQDLLDQHEVKEALSIYLFLDKELSRFDDDGVEMHLSFGNTIGDAKAKIKECILTCQQHKELSDLWRQAFCIGIKGGFQQAKEMREQVREKLNDLDTDFTVNLPLFSGTVEGALQKNEEEIARLDRKIELVEEHNRLMVGLNDLLNKKEYDDALRSITALRDVELELMPQDRDKIKEEILIFYGTVDLLKRSCECEQMQGNQIERVKEVIGGHRFFERKNEDMKILKEKKIDSTGTETFCLLIDTFKSRYPQTILEYETVLNLTNHELVPVKKEIARLEALKAEIESRLPKTPPRLKRVVGGSERRDSPRLMGRPEAGIKGELKRLEESFERLEKKRKNVSKHENLLLPELTGKIMKLGGKTVVGVEGNPQMEEEFRYKEKFEELVVSLRDATRSLSRDQLIEVNKVFWKVNGAAEDQLREVREKYKEMRKKYKSALANTYMAEASRNYKELLGSLNKQAMLVGDGIDDDKVKGRFGHIKRCANGCLPSFTDLAKGVEKSKVKSEDLNFLSECWGHQAESNMKKIVKSFQNLHEVAFFLKNEEQIKQRVFDLKFMVYDALEKYMEIDDGGETVVFNEYAMKFQRIGKKESSDLDKRKSPDRKKRFSDQIGLRFDLGSPFDKEKPMQKKVFFSNLFKNFIFDKSFNADHAYEKASVIRLLLLDCCGEIRLINVDGLDSDEMKKRLAFEGQIFNEWVCEKRKKFLDGDPITLGERRKIIRGEFKKLSNLLPPSFYSSCVEPLFQQWNALLDKPKEMI